MKEMKASSKCLLTYVLDCWELFTSQIKGLLLFKTDIFALAASHNLLMMWLC